MTTIEASSELFGMGLLNAANRRPHHVINQSSRQSEIRTASHNVLLFTRDQPAIGDGQVRSDDGREEEPNPEVMRALIP